jgi:hypothetical protein
MADCAMLHCVRLAKAINRCVFPPEEAWNLLKLGTFMTEPFAEVPGRP